MTLRELIDLAGGYPLVLLAVFVALPLAALLLGWLHRPGEGGLAPQRYLYGLLVYLACFPGIFAALLTGYTLFFHGGNLLDVNLLIYLLPSLSMLVTLVLIGQRVDFDEIPGFDRLWALMVIIALSFGLLLAISKTRLWVIFGGSLLSLLVILGVLFGLLQGAAHVLLGRRGRPVDRRG